MVSRTVQECDLYKTEYDPEQTVIISIKAKGKRKGRSYDLSPEAAETLEKALVSNIPHKIVAQNQTSTKRIPPDVSNDIDFEYDDDAFVAQKMRERVESASVSEEDNSEIQPIVLPETEAEKDPDKCMHPNKTPPRERVVNGKRGYWHICKDCGARIKPVTAKTKKTYLQAKPPAGINIKTHESEDRKRD